MVECACLSVCSCATPSVRVRPGGWYLKSCVSLGNRQMVIEFFDSEAEVERFLVGVANVCYFSFGLAIVSVLAFFCGLTLIGRVKKYYAFPFDTVR